VIGIGGISCASDALEFLIAGCRAVQIGTANFVDPGVHERVLAGLRDYLERHGLDDVSSVVGTLEYPGLPRTGDAPGTGGEGGAHEPP
jgi:dihydroorotate dehydrogenase (NAD+) catalytic subunit